MRYLRSVLAQLPVSARSRAQAIALSSVLLGGALLGAATPAFAICDTSAGGDDGAGVCDVTTSVVQIAPPPGAAPSVAFSSGTQTKYVKYRVVLTHYAVRREGFSQVKFVADTSVLNASAPGPANFFAASPPVVANSGNAEILNPANACTISTTHIVCTFNFDALKQPFDYPPGGPEIPTPDMPQPTITFDVTVQSPTGAPAGGENPSPTLNLVSDTTVQDVDGHPELEHFALTSTTTLTVPDPTVVETFVPVAGGTVTTGDQGGAATCAPGNQFVTIVKVPAAAQVGVNLNFAVGEAPANTLFFSRIQIPDLSNLTGPPQLFGVGTHWYDPDAKSKLVVNTLRRDKCTIGSGTGSLKDGLLILKEKILYKPDVPYPAAPEDPPVYKPLLLCFVTSGPFPGQPCIVYAQVYTRFNLPRNLPLFEANKYLGDHEWVIFSNENGRLALPGG